MTHETNDGVYNFGTIYLNSISNVIKYVCVTQIFIVKEINEWHQCEH